MSRHQLHTNKAIDSTAAWAESSVGCYGAFCERVSTIFLVLPSQLPTTFCPCRSPLGMMVNV